MRVFLYTMCTCALQCNVLYITGKVDLIFGKWGLNYYIGDLFAAWHYWNTECQAKTWLFSILVTLKLICRQIYPLHDIILKQIYKS